MKRSLQRRDCKSVYRILRLNTDISADTRILWIWWRSLRLYQHFVDRLDDWKRPRNAHADMKVVRAVNHYSNVH
jgi:hypothetical protein